VAAAFAVVVALAGGATGWAAALVLLVLAEATDLLDGWAARRYGSVTELGGLVDPLCDSLSRLTVFFTAALAGWLWIGVPLVMAGRDIVVAYVRTVVGRVGGETSARLSGKVKAIVQGGSMLVVMLLAHPSAGSVAWLHVAGWRRGVGLAVIAVTAWSMADYVRAGWPAIRRMARRV